MRLRAGNTRWAVPAGLLAILVGATLVVLAPSLIRAWANRTKPEVLAERVTLDGRAGGRVFDGVGGISGSSSRLLYDYPPRQRRQILDYLFKPGYGASLQILKVEIGGDTSSTVIAEPSHMRSRGAVNCHRGFEWWMMKQARARNPGIKFYGLMWSGPGWFSGGLWSHDMVRYVLTWLSCAKRSGVSVSYIGGADERFRYEGDQAPFYIALKNALRTTFPAVKVVATDEHEPPHYWAAAKQMQHDPAYRGAVDVLGEHDVCVWKSLYTRCHATKTALDLGKPLWVSEQGSQSALAGAGPLARAMNRGYIDAQLTGNINGPLLAAYYGDTEVGGRGFVLAEWPWSGYYRVSPSVWVDAQTTQFVRPGWRYIRSASGYLRGGGSYVTLRSPHGGDYSVVIETMDGAAPEKVTLVPTGGLSAGWVQIWSTDVRSADPRDWFVHDATLRPRNGAVSLVARPGHVYTVSTTSGQHKGSAAARRGTGPSMTLPVPYYQGFEHPERTRMVRYFQDLEGAFEARPCMAGRPGTCYQQVLTQRPIPWHSTTLRPTTIVGDPLWWGAYRVSVDAMLEHPGAVELLGRVEKYDQYLVSGYHFGVAASGRWSLYTVDASGDKTTLASGRAAFGIGRWHRLSLVFAHGMATAEVGGHPLATVAATAHRGGQIGMGVSSWTTAQFDRLSVAPTAPWPRFVDDSAITATATSEQNRVYKQASYPARDAVDARVDSCWWSRQNPAPAAPLPQAITLRLRHPRMMDGLAYRPPVDQQGNVTSYAVYLSTDGKRYVKVAAGGWPAQSATQIAAWRPQRARFVRFAALRSSKRGVAACELQIALTPLNRR